jgi:lactoylglutathione lyase
VIGRLAMPSNGLFGRRRFCGTFAVGAKDCFRRGVMPFRINHVHIKASDPRKAAEWWVRAFAFKIVSDETRVFGDRFVRCLTEDGAMTVSISNARTNETLAPGNATAHFGLEHFAIETDDIGADIARLQELGARLQEGPTQAPNGVRFAFLSVPDDVRIELLELPKAAAQGGSR